LTKAGRRDRNLNPKGLVTRLLAAIARAPILHKFVTRMKTEIGSISWHNIVLKGRKVTLRPFTDSDWKLLFRWCNDPEVLYYSDGADVKGYDIDTIKNKI
jgi:RimJ/RimL family protein N-acetyltransferase